MVKRVIIASHRGFCAGVERAVDTVERALAIYGPPVYVRKQIVHNTHVVRDLEARGAIFVVRLVPGAWRGGDRAFRLALRRRLFQAPPGGDSRGGLDGG